MIVAKPKKLGHVPPKKFGRVPSHLIGPLTLKSNTTTKSSSTSAGVTVTPSSPVAPVVSSVKRPLLLAVLKRTRPLAVAMAEWIEKNRPCECAIVDRLRRCARKLIYRPGKDGRRRLFKAMFCRRHLLCATCVGGRALEFQRKVTARLMFLVRESPSLLFRNVTFTFKAFGTLSKVVGRLQKSLTRLMRIGKRHRSKGFKGKRSQASYVVASFQVIEIKAVGWDAEAPTQLRWHVHAHTIWLCDGEVDEKKLRREWRKIALGSWEVKVDAFHAYASHVAGSPVLIDALAEDCRRLIGYFLKAPDDPDPAVTFARFEQLRKGGKKCPPLITTYGKLRGIGSDPKPAKDDAEPAGADTAEYVFQFKDGEYVLADHAPVSP